MFRGVVTYLGTPRSSTLGQGSSGGCLRQDVAKLRCSLRHIQENAHDGQVLQMKATPRGSWKEEGK